MSREMKAMKYCSFYITKDALNNNKMSGTRSCHKLTNNVNYMSNVWSGDSKIDKSTKQLPIESVITEKSTINSKKMSIGLYRSEQS